MVNKKEVSENSTSLFLGSSLLIDNFLCSSISSVTLDGSRQKKKWAYVNNVANVRVWQGSRSSKQQIRQHVAALPMKTVWDSQHWQDQDKARSVNHSKTVREREKKQNQMCMNSLKTEARTKCLFVVVQHFLLVCLMGGVEKKTNNPKLFFSPLPKQRVACWHGQPDGPNWTQLPYRWDREVAHAASSPRQTTKHLPCDSLLLPCTSVSEESHLVSWQPCLSSQCSGSGGADLMTEKNGQKILAHECKSGGGRGSFHEQTRFLHKWTAQQEWPCIPGSEVYIFMRFIFHNHSGKSSLKLSGGKYFALLNKQMPVRLIYYEQQSLLLVGGKRGLCTHRLKMHQYKDITTAAAVYKLVVASCSYRN